MVRLSTRRPRLRIAAVLTPASSRSARRQYQAVGTSETPPRRSGRARSVLSGRGVVLQHAHRPAPLRVDAAALHLADGAPRRAGDEPLDLEALSRGEPERADGVKRRVEDGAEVLGDAQLHPPASIG